MTLKKSKPQYKKRRKQTKRKQKKIKSKAKKRKRKITRKLKLKGGGLFDDMKAFVGMKSRPVTDSTEKGNCPTTNDKINKFFGIVKDNAIGAAGAAKKAGDQALGEVTDMAKDAKDKATKAADNATAAVVGDKNEKQKVGGKCKCCGKIWTEEDEKLAREKKLKEEKRKEDEKDSKTQEVKISVDDKDDKTKADDKADKLKEVDLDKDNLDDDTMELLELTQDGDDIFDMGTLKTN